MAASAADRDLLFGLLALQNGLIDQVQLVAAFQAWTLDKARALADHLVARGDLEPDDRSAVEALVARHLKKHGGDVGRSLAAIPAGPSTRESLAALGDPKIEHTLTQLAFCSAGDPDRTASYAVGNATTDGQRFRVLRPHARGGLGAVFVALDEELHREVALKQILDHHADDAVSRARFLLEAEITGNLEHPGIVPVYGLGTYADGRPFYAMRFIQGGSLKEAIHRFHRDETPGQDPGRRSLELRRLLRRFTDVCNAIEYAHGRGVLHRDIKPGNIIVGKYGETLVVDWGLAKAIGREDAGATGLDRPMVPQSSSGQAETQPGSALGTPAFMSPEQAAGELDRLGPRSDVYSLGTTFYCLLAGRPPFEGEDVGALLQAVREGRIPPLRAVAPSVDPALEAISKKAMSLRPEDRYSSARALADDIDRWMADEPVAAWPEPLSGRARRWARRNRATVRAAAASVLVALAGTATVLGVQTQANHNLLAANTQVREERDRARQNFDLARRAVDDYLTRVGQNPLLAEQGFHDLRQELLEAELRYYRDFLNQRSDDPGLRVETALAHERVGSILDELDRHEDALAEFDQALALLEPLAGRRPTELAIATARIRLESDRLQVLWESARYPEALTAFERASKLWEAQVAARGGTEELTDIMSRTFITAGRLYSATGRLEDSVGILRKAYEFSERAVGGHPGDLAAARNYLDASWKYAESLHPTGRVDEARELCIRSVSFGESPLREHPRDFGIRENLAYLNLDLALFEALRGRPSECLERRRKAADIAGALAREHPTSMRARIAWACTLGDLSQAQAGHGLHAEAEQSVRTAIEVYEGLCREFPSNSNFRERTAASRLMLGVVQFFAGKNAAALATIHNAVATLEASEEPIFQFNVAMSLGLASSIVDPGEGPAGVDRRRHDADRAVTALRRAVALGWSEASRLKTNPFLKPLRARGDFQAIEMDLAFPADPFTAAP